MSTQLDRPLRDLPGDTGEVGDCLSDASPDREVTLPFAPGSPLVKEVVSLAAMLHNLLWRAKSKFAMCRRAPGLLPIKEVTLLVSDSAPGIPLVKEAAVLIAASSISHRRVISGIAMCRRVQGPPPVKEVTLGYFSLGT